MVHEKGKLQHRQKSGAMRGGGVCKPVGLGKREKEGRIGDTEARGWLEGVSRVPKKGQDRGAPLHRPLRAPHTSETKDGGQEQHWSSRRQGGEGVGVTHTSGGGAQGEGEGVRGCRWRRPKTSPPSSTTFRSRLQTNISGELTKCAANSRARVESRGVYTPHGRGLCVAVEPRKGAVSCQK